MKVKQTVTAKFCSVYTGWNSLEFYTENGDEIQIQMTEDNYLSLAKTLAQKAKRIERIQKEQAEEAAELAEENTDE